MTAKQTSTGHVSAASHVLKKSSKCWTSNPINSFLNSALQVQHDMLPLSKGTSLNESMYHFLDLGCPCFRSSVWKVSCNRAITFFRNSSWCYKLLGDVGNRALFFMKNLFRSKTSKNCQK